MEEKILIFGHKNPDTDSICSSIVKEKLNKRNGYKDSKAVRLGKINKETQYVLNYLKIESPELIEEIDEGQKIIMIDHNEFNQSVKGIENAKIMEVVDHHRIANFQTAQPIFFTARPYGCTATILYKEFIKNGLTINKEEAILMASAIISDTLLLKSPTTTNDDKQALKHLVEIAEINVETYGVEMLKAGTNLEDFSAEELISLDAKTLDKNAKRFVIAQVNTICIEDVLKRQLEIESAMMTKIKDEGLQLFVFAITDILNSNTEIIALGQDTEKIIKQAFSEQLQNNRVFLEGVVSRKKQILPNIDKYI